MAMSTTQSNPMFHSNRYTADASCEHCEGVLRHEAWCITRNSNVMNAWDSVLDPAKLSLHDQLILHALGVAWRVLCDGACKALPATS